MPALVIVPPKGLKNKYPQAYSNLLFNSKNRLTSHFDIWRTFRDILNKEFTKSSSQVEKTKYGISLMQPIPDERDCEGAGIPSHWCACGSYVTISSGDPRSHKAGEILVNSINAQLSQVGDVCLTYKDFTVVEAKLKVPSNDIEIIIETKPLKAVFRSSIRLTENQPIITAIERMDRYGEKSACIRGIRSTNMVLIKLCICKSWTEKN